MLAFYFGTAHLYTLKGIPYNCGTQKNPNKNILAYDYM